MACCVLIASVIAALLALARGRNPANDPRAWRLKAWRLTKDTSHD